MKQIFLLATIFALSGLTRQENCPIVPVVGNAINFTHLFKEQSDTDFNFLNDETTATLMVQVVATETVNGDVNGNAHHIVFKLENSRLPARTWYYMVEAKFLSNGSLHEITKFTRIRQRSGVTDATINTFIDVFFEATAAEIAALTYNLQTATAITGCCFYKLDYVNFYYMFTEYFNVGRGLEMDNCP